eukprot:scaffold74171_cov69-Phaeocystis_antarctica.AAC.1
MGAVLKALQAPTARPALCQCSRAAVAWCRTSSGISMAFVMIAACSAASTVSLCCEPCGVRRAAAASCDESGGGVFGDGADTGAGEEAGAIEEARSCADGRWKLREARGGSGPGGSGEGGGSVAAGSSSCGPVDGHAAACSPLPSRDTCSARSMATTAAWCSSARGRELHLREAGRPCCCCCTGVLVVSASHGRRSCPPLLRGTPRSEHGDDGCGESASPTSSRSWSVAGLLLRSPPLPTSLSSTSVARNARRCCSTRHNSQHKATLHTPTGSVTQTRMRPPSMKEADSRRRGVADWWSAV